MIIEKDEPKTNVVEIKTANINFEVEEMEDLELKPDLGLPDEFPPLTDTEKFGMDFSLKSFIIFTMEISNFLTEWQLPRKKGDFSKNALLSI